MRTSRVSINQKELVLRNGSRVKINMSKLTQNKLDTIDSLELGFIFAHTMISTYNQDFTMTLDDFIDYCDENPEIMIDISAYILSFQTDETQPEDSESPDSKKKQ